MVSIADIVANIADNGATCLSDAAAADAGNKT
jgi:hypothetical protein